MMLKLMEYVSIECFVIFGVLMLLQLSNQVDWLPALIIRQGCRMELECSTTNDTISVNWWRTLREDEPVHIRKIFTLIYEQANLNHSGLYECFDGYDGKKEFRVFMRRVLVVDSSCNESPRNDSSMTMKCEVKFRHVEFDQVEIFWKCNGMTVKGNCTPSTDPEQCRKLVSIQTFPAKVLTSWNFFVQFQSASMQLWPNNICALATPLSVGRIHGIPNSNTTTNNSIREKTIQRETITDPIHTGDPTLVGILRILQVFIAGLVISVVFVLLTSCCTKKWKLRKSLGLRQDSYVSDSSANTVAMVLRKAESNSSDSESDPVVTDTIRHTIYSPTYEEIYRRIEPGSICLNPPVRLW